MKNKKKHSLKRWIAYPFFFICLALFFCDLFCEIRGIPSFLEEKIEQELKRKDVYIGFENIRAGIFSGIVFDKIKMADGDFPDLTVFSADNLRVSLSWTFRKGLTVESLFISNGCLKILFFPERGRESADDCVNLTNIEALLTKKGDDIEIHYATAFLDGFLLNISGDAKNLFSPDSHLNRSIGISRKNLLSSSSFSSFIPFDTRSFLMREFIALRKSNFRSTPKLQIKISLDMKDLPGSSLSADIKIPSFGIRELAVSEISGNVCVRENNLVMDSLRVSFGKDEDMEIKGKLDLLKLDVKADIFGRLNLSKIAGFISIPELEEFSFSGKIAEFRAELDNYSFISGDYKGEIECEIPLLLYRNKPFENLRLKFAAASDGQNRNIIRTDKFNLSLKKENFIEFSGIFDRCKKFISGNVNGCFFPSDICPALDDETAKKIGTFFKFGDEKVSFSGRLDKISRSFSESGGNLQIFVPEIKIKGTEFRNLSGRITVAEGIIGGRNIELSTKMGNKIRTEFDFNPAESDVSMSFYSNGSPVFIYELLDEADKASLKLIFDRFKWPFDSNAVELYSKIRFFCGSNPYFFISGNAALVNFEYNDTKFDYGACNYYIDSDRLIVIPRIVLQQAENHAFVSLAYDNRSGTKDFPAEPCFSVPQEKTDKLYFEMESTIPGNSVLNCIIPEWKNSKINLSGTTPLSVHGVIDYLNDDGSFFSAKLTNASGEWKGIPLKKINTQIEYGKQCLEIKKLSAEIFEGQFAFDYVFSFKTGRGNCSAELKNAGFLPLVNCLDFKNISRGKTGQISGSMKADFNCGENDNLFMNGNGEITVREADIWKIPLLKGLSDLLGGNLISYDWGEISEADCKFILRDDHFKTDSIQTNGNAIALSAEGTYCWNTGETDFYVRAKILKNLLPFELLSRMMDPVSWMLEARLYGKDNDLKWEQISGLKKLFK